MDAPKAWTVDDVAQYLSHPIAPVPTSPLYQAGLLLVALALLLLQATYVAMVALAGYGTLRYLLATPAIVASMGANQFTLIIAAAPLVAGVMVTFFLLKPLLARPPQRPKLYGATRDEEPVLFAFIDHLCDRIGAPRPSAIEFDLQVNASARLNGWLSLFRSDLTLTIGLPLAAGMSLPQFTGVLGHEFGHFSQRAGLRLYYLIENIRRWFTRVAHDRDRWDAWLDRNRTRRAWQIKAILSLAYGCVVLSRRILQGLLFCAKVVSSWFSRQLEFNADRHEAELTGARTFQETMGRLSVLGAESQRIWQTLDHAFKARRLCDDFVVALRSFDATVSDEIRGKVVESTFQAKTGRWDTHPSHRERCDKVRSVEGVLPALDSTPAEVIFADFAGLCRKVTRHHYQVTLGDKLENVTLVPASEFTRQADRSEIRAQGIRTFFGAMKQPARYFRLAAPGEMAAQIEIKVHMSDVSAEYWRMLEESLLRNAALEFKRSGGRIKPESFRVSNGEFATVAAEAVDSRQGITTEMTRLRELCAGQSQLLCRQNSDWVEAYRGMSQQQEVLLELRHRLVAFNTLRANLKFLKLAAAANACEDRARGLADSCREILASLTKCASPLTPGHSLSEELLLFDAPDSIEPDELAARVLNRADWVGTELLGELCAAVAGNRAANG